MVSRRVRLNKAGKSSPLAERKKTPHFTPAFFHTTAVNEALERVSYSITQTVGFFVLKNLLDGELQIRGTISVAH